MKILYKYLLVLTVIFVLCSCDKGEVFTGSPVGTNVSFETLQGTISTTESGVVSSQSFPISITLPKSFPVDVSVEVTAFLPNTDKRTRKYFIVPANTLTLAGPNVNMNAPSSEAGTVTTLPFNMAVQVYLSAINTTPVIGVPFGFAGKQYSLTSNVLTLDYGDSSYGGVNPNRAVVRLDWLGPYSGANYNNLNIRLKKDGVVTTVAGPSQTTQPIYGTTTSTGRYETVNFLSTAADGIYTIEVFAVKLTADPMDMPYRFTVRFPDDTVRTFSGTIPALTLGTAATAIPKLQIVKSGVTYVVTSI